VEKHQQKPTSRRAYVYCGYLNRNNYIAGSSHNLYSDYLVGKHKILAPQQDPDTPVLIVSAVGLLAVIALAILT
jgi:hypothetical protein